MASRSRVHAAPLARRVIVASLAASAAAVALGAAAPARAERLPVRTYQTTDGLADANVWAAARDRRGFLWFGTEDGLSRFDGARFETFERADGLPDVRCHAVAEGGDGTLWIGTVGGLAWLDPDARAERPRFTARHLDGDADAIDTMLVEPGGAVLFGTEAGLYRAAAGPRGPIERLGLGDGAPPAVYAIARGADGTLWLGTSRGLIERRADGTARRYRVLPRDLLDDRTMGVAVDHDGRVWVGSLGLGVIALVPPAGGAPVIADPDTLWDAAGRAPRPAPGGADAPVTLPRAPGELRRYGTADGVPEKGNRRGMLVDAQGDLWIGSADALLRFDGRRFEAMTPERGFPAGMMCACLEDGAGNVWFCGATTGASRLLRHGLVTYGEQDGLASAWATSVYDGPGGALYATTYRDGHVMHRLDGDRWTAVVPRLPDGVPSWGAWGANQIEVLDHDGRWWFATSAGLARYPRVAQLEDLAATVPTFYTMADGLPGRDILHLYADRRGDVWIATMSKVGLARWDRARDAIVPITAPALAGFATAFAEDRDGGLWIGFDDGRLVCLPGGDLAHAETVAAAQLTGAPIVDLHLDRAGALWVATGDGVARIVDPSRGRTIYRLGRRDGLSSMSTTAITEDDRGRIYVATLRGIDRFDVATGAIGHLTLADGLPQEYVFAAHRDRAGTLWFATRGGIARLIPDDPPPTPPPPALITELRAGGATRPLAAGGARAVDDLGVAADDGLLDVAFTSPSFAAGSPVEFQYRLGDGDVPWSEPTTAREVHYAHLAPGAYRFEVRAVYAGGLVSAPAGFVLEVRPPLWQRWWFVAGVALLVALAGWRLYRWRVGHLVAVERVRTRIATDLHDDLGASLSRIAILSEVAARKARDGAADDTRQVVGDIGKSARELVDVAADIVWSTDPRKDDLASLLVRLRGYAADVLEGRGMAWTLEAPPDPARIKLGPDERRHLYLIVKEAIHNAAKHSGATRVDVRVVARAGRVEASVEDDGRGFDPAAPPRGNGLTNMRARAEKAGGALTIAAAAPRGTRVVLALPLEA